MNLSQTLTRLIREAIDRREAPCATALILRGGEPIAYAEAGEDIATGQPVRRDTIFRLYSQTKPMTAAAAAILMERGVVDVAEPVEKYLPGFRGQKVVFADGHFEPARRPVTIMDLLGMTAGLSYPGEDAGARYAADLFDRNAEAMRLGEGMDTVAFANAIGQLPLSFHPGDEFRYSTCADVLGAVLEAADGRPFDRILHEELIDPLGMKDTDFWVPEEKRDRFVSCARRVPGGLERWQGLHLCVGDYTKRPAFCSGGAGLVSTLDDYARFAQMLLNGGEMDGRRYMSAATLRWLTAPQVRPGLFWDWDNGYSYGKLMRVCVDPGKAPGLAFQGEYGWDGWLGTYFLNVPAYGLTILICMNVTDTGTSSLARRIRNAVYASVSGLCEATDAD